MSKYKILLMSKTASALIPNIERFLPNKDDFEIASSDNLKYFDVEIIEQYFHLIFIQYSYYLEHKDKLKNINNKKVVILANFTNNTILSDILSELSPYHLIGLTDINALSDIKDFIMHLKSKALWKPEDLIADVEQLKEMKIKDSENYQENIDEMVEFLELSRCFKDFGNQLKHVANEILTNALYNAPIENGEYLYRDKTRTEKVTMKPGKEVDFKIFENDKKIVLYIKDYYGSLTKKNIEDHINNAQVKNKEGGAGVGIYLSFRYCHKLIYNVISGESTEVMIVLNKFRRNKDYELIDKSFHFFIK